MVTDDWTHNLIDTAIESLDSNENGTLSEVSRRELFEEMDDMLPVHSKLRRNTIHFLSAISLLSKWDDDPRLPRDLFMAPYMGLHLCRGLLIEGAPLSSVYNTIISLEGYDEVLLERLGPQERSARTTRERQCVLSATASAISYSRLPTREEDWTQPDTPRDRLLPEFLACIGHTGYPVHGQWERERVRQFWHWWINNVIKYSLQPVDSLLKSLSKLEISPYGVRSLTYKGY